MSITTLEEQQHELIKRTAYIKSDLSDMLNGKGFSGDVMEVVANRLKSGHKVFGSRMFTMDAAELRVEAIEELADAFLWHYAYLYVEEHGPLREPLAVGDTVRSLVTAKLGEYGKIVHAYTNGVIYPLQVSFQGQPSLAFNADELKLVKRA